MVKDASSCGGVAVWGRVRAQTALSYTLLEYKSFSQSVYSSSEQWLSCKAFKVIKIQIYSDRALGTSR